MLITPHAIEQLAGRIELAYLRRRPQAIGNEPDPKLWDVAARALAEAHRRHPWLPIDPELFVASQPSFSPLGDPWQHLAPAHAVKRYRKRVVQMIRGLRRELAGELSWIERKIRSGATLEEALRWRTRKVSPLGRFVAALRAGRPDLAERFRPGAQDQHESCPLYRAACSTLIEPALYPVLEILPGLVLRRRIGPPERSPALN